MRKAVVLLAMSWFGVAPWTAEPTRPVTSEHGPAREANLPTRARSPLAVESLVRGPVWVIEGDQTFENLGGAVAAAGDVNGDGYGDILVGASGYDNEGAERGRAHLYLGGPAGAASTPAWTVEGDQPGALFGTSVATAGDVNGDGYSDVLVGASNYDNGQTDEGRAYLFLGGPTGLATTPAWMAESDQAGALFGNALSTAGDVNGDGYSDVLVAAVSFDGSIPNTGRVYLYLGSAAGLSAGAAWTAQPDQAGLFGRCVSTAGDVNGDGYADVLVGAPNMTDGVYFPGGAFLYLGTATGLGAEPSWLALGVQNQERFGYSVAAAGDVNGDGFADVLVGAYRHDLPSPLTDAGRVLLFLGGPGGLGSAAAWVVVGDQTQGFLGESVSTAGDVNGDGYADLLAGEPGYDGGQVDEGRISLYLGGPAGPGTTPAWTGEVDVPYLEFGLPLGTAGDLNGDGFSDFIVGAPLYTTGSRIDHGRAYVFHGGPSPPGGTAAWAGAGGQASSSYGMSVAPAGDVNGDGLGDLLVGAQTFDNGHTDEGRAWLYLGGAAGPSAEEDWTAEPNQAGAAFGYSVSSAGDVNGDGYGDVLVGAPYASNGQSLEGQAFVFLGSGSGLSAVPAWTAEGDQANAFFGLCVAAAGDVNGDGFGDLLIGAYGYDGGQTDEGRAYLFLGTPTGPAAAPAWTWESDQTGAYFGRSVAAAGDVNGDGFSDVIVGGHSFDNGQLNEGRAWLFLGGRSGLGSGPAWVAEGDQANAYFGYSVSTAGDVNGDGFSDLLVGARGFDGGETDEGKVWLYLGGASGPSATAAWSVEGNQAYGAFGAAVASGGDLDGDGYCDILVGAPAWNEDFVDEGRAVAYFGSAAGLAGSPAWTVFGGQAYCLLGDSLSMAGDVNGDGFGDVLVGAPSYDGAASNEGGAFLFWGNGGAGVSARPRQLQAGGGGPIAPLGRAVDGGFRLASTARSPFGAGLVKLEWQVVPLGGTMDPAHNPIQSDAGWEESGLAGAALSHDLLLPEGDGPYLWRVRHRWNTADSPYQRHGPWRSLTTNALWEADLRRVPACVPPDEVCFIGSATQAGAVFTLNWQDPHGLDQRTGWNVRRSSDPGQIKADWPIVGHNVADMDEGAPDIQWLDLSGAHPGPGGVWYYQVTAYNAYCPAEGPF